MSKKHITGYLVAGVFTIVEIVIIGLGYSLWHWPPAILIPALGILTFFGVMIIVNLFSQSNDLRKGEIRNAIAASLLAVYFFLISVTLFAPSSPLLRFNQPETANAPVTITAPTETPNPDATATPEAQVAEENAAAEAEASASESTSVNDILKGLLTDFTKLIMIVVGFYFGGRSAEEIVKTISIGNSGQASPAPAPKPTDTPNAEQPATDPEKPK